MDALMSFFGGIESFFGSINFEAIVQLTMVALIMISGPVIIFLLAARGGDL
jgi:hypothetical protein